MNWTDLPPLSALRAFAAYAETGSVALAGEALNVSHAAISQQMRALERHMGVALLDRSARKLSLTSDGQALAYALQDGFATIADTVSALTGAEDDRPLQVACTPGFAANWLMPRLARFRAAHPDIELMIHPSPALTDPAAGGIDVALRYGTGPWPGFEHALLMAAPLAVVGRPEVFGDPLPGSPAELTRLPWLQELGTNEASRWLADHNVTEARVTAVTHVPGNLVIDGIRNGQGIAVTTRLAVEEDLASGRLIALFEERGDVGYCTVTRPGVPRPPLKAFLRWIRAEARRTP